MFTFNNAFAVVVDSFQNLERSGDAKVRQLRYSILKFDFLVVLVGSEAILQYTVTLSQNLQQKQQTNTDIEKGVRESEVLVNLLTELHRNDAKWDYIYQTGVDMAPM